MDIVFELVVLLFALMVWLFAPANLGLPYHPPGAHVCTNYPDDEGRVTHKGRVLVLLRISATGQVSRSTILHSSRDKELDQATQTCVAEWLYKSKLRDGKPIEYDWPVRVVWSIKDVPTSN